MEDINSSYFDGECDYCKKNKKVQFIIAKGTVKTMEAEYIIRDIVKLRNGKQIVGFPRLCSDCFIEISRKLK